MTRKEAIKLLICEKVCVEDVDGNIGGERVRQAYDMAIEALQAEAVEVVRCKYCKQMHIGGSVTHYYWCDLWDREVDCNNYCSWGERLCNHNWRKGGEDE